MAALKSERATQRSTDPVAEAWRSGDLAELLFHPVQLEAYRQYREWEAQPTYAPIGVFSRIFVLDWGKRTGKTTMRFATRVEDCIRSPKRRAYRYATAFAKDIEEIVDDVAQYVFDSCPRSMRPVYRLGGKSDGENDARRAGTGFYFPKGTVLKLVGLDKNPDGMRGRASDGDDVSEAAFIRHLKYSVKNVLYHQYQGRPHARMCMESSAPLDPDSDYDRVFVDDAKLRGAYHYATIDDNPRLSDEEREEFIRAAGGREHDDCKREYFNLRVRNKERTVIPEYDDQKHVGRIEVPAFAFGFVFQDPGIKDPHAIVWSYLHPELELLVVLRSFHKRNMGTAEAAEIIKATNAELFETLKWWDGPVEHENPALNISDVDARMQLDMKRDHDLPTRAADKSKNNYGTGEAKLLRVRNAFRDGKILISADDPGPLRAQLNRGVWNEGRTDFQRWKPSETNYNLLGHLDALMALAYGWDAIQPWRNRNPTRPALYDRHDQQRVFGPRYKEPMTRNQSITEAMQAGRSKADRKRAAKCPVCGKVRVLATWMNGQFVCSQECHDKWVYRATGGKPP